MIREDFYVLGGGRHVGYRHGAMMILRHKLVIGKFYIQGGRGISFWGIVNWSRQWPGVGRAPIINDCVIMFRVQWRRNKNIRMTNIHNGALLILIHFVLLFASLCCHLFL